MPGTLFLVGTPIGNLGDITLRALETLRAVQQIAAEDTRRTRGLLTHFEISGKTMHSLDAHASPHKLAGVLALLENGQDVALVTDAGMPSISDPGTALVRLAVERGVTVSAIPGPSALTAAVAASGLVDASFAFLGFLPRQGQKRRAALERVARGGDPTVLFESPQRLQKTLRELAELAPDRAAAICRELSKLHEEIRRGTLNELALLEHEWRGEITLVVAGGSVQDAEVETNSAELEAQIAARLNHGASVKTVVAELAPTVTLARRELYAIVQQLYEARDESASSSTPEQSEPE
ncbi:MAG TPA: 16S rRNA (cytidine(1402)-2'-O)-methyltransferase [Polyangiaceae bacterium]